MNSLILRNEVEEKYHNLTSELIRRKLTISTMESCTSGLIASLITDASGASDIFENGLVTYSNQAKISQGLDGTVIDEYGVYSEETAASMATLCREKFGTDIGVGVTGSIGRIDPANSDSVPGEVYIAVNFLGDTEAKFLSVTSPARMDAKYEVADKVCELMRTFL